MPGAAGPTRRARAPRGPRLPRAARGHPRCRRVPRVAESHGHVAEQPPPLRATDRAAAEALGEGGGGEPRKLREVGGEGPGPRLERGAAVPAAPPVPRAHVLADVAAEDVTAHPLARLLGDRTLHLDGQVADAPRRVEQVRRRQRTGRAGVQAGGAAPARVRPRRVGRELEVGDDLAQEEPGPVLGVEEARVLAPRAEAGRGRVRLLRDGPGVDVRPRLEGPRLRAQGAHDPVQECLHHVVVVVAPGVAGDPAAVAGCVSGVRVGGVVLQPHADDRARPGEGGAQVAPLRDLRGEVRHLARVAPRDPLREEPQLGRGLGAGDPREVEARLEGEGLHARRQGRAVHRLEYSGRRYSVGVPPSPSSPPPRARPHSWHSAAPAACSVPQAGQRT